MRVSRKRSSGLKVVFVIIIIHFLFSKTKTFLSYLIHSLEYIFCVCYYFFFFLFPRFSVSVGMLPRSLILLTKVSPFFFYLVFSLLLLIFVSRVIFTASLLGLFFVFVFFFLFFCGSSAFLKCQREITGTQREEAR